MKVLVPLAALVSLAACAATSAPQAPESAIAGPAPSGASAATTRVAQMLAAAGGAEAPTQADVERLLGPADITRHDGAGAALTYRYESCALLLLFSADARSAMRLAQAHPSARHTGQAAPSLQQCAAEASARGA